MRIGRYYCVVPAAVRLFLRNPKEEMPIFVDYQERVFEALKAAEIEIPFPHLQLFIDEAKALDKFPALIGRAQGS